MDTLVRLTSPPLAKGYRLVFGDPCGVRQVECELGCGGADAIFSPKRVFCLEVYDSLLFGNTRWALYVAETVDTPEKAIFVPNVFPGARILLEVKGKEKVIQANDWITSISLNRNPSDISPSVFLKQNAIINTAFTVLIPRKPLF